MGKLDGKVAVVTGGSRGQGASHVRKFVEEGAKVVFSDILVEEGQALAEEIGSSVKFVKHDVTNEEEWKNVINEAESTFGPVNILVNNAGISLVKGIEELTEKEFRRVIDINLLSVFLGMKTVFPSMMKAENGSIINVSSQNGIQASAGSAAYDASKFAVRGITKSAALEFGKYDIRVNSLHPGVVETPMISSADSKDAVEGLKKVIPLQRIAQPEDMSNLVLFLASDDSNFSTGSEFIADGGVTASLF